MCGITGIYHKEGAAVDKRVVDRMTNSLRHRGPDDKGVHIDGSLGLGYTRLSVIDLSPQGHQPMRSDDGRYVLVYNGEIYNCREIRQTLSAKGYYFRGHSDTEVALCAYMEWGKKAFCKFEGMFAMAVWDTHDRCLHLARDRFGIKPLYFCNTAQSLVFGSEIKALLASGEVPARVNWAGLNEYLHYDTALGPHTLFQGINKLLPGHLLSLDAHGVKVEPYASIFRVDTVRDDFQTATRKVQGLLEKAVKDHLVSDVPVGVFLSGGIDSSAITAFAARHYDGRLKTYSAGFDFERGVNELPQARMVAEHFGTDHQELHISGGSLTEVIERLVRCHDAPFGDPANIPLYLLSEQLAVGGGPKVILQGDGGDEIFAGYKRYTVGTYERWMRVARLIAWTRPLIPRWSRWYERCRYLEELHHTDSSARIALMMSRSYHAGSSAQIFTPRVRILLEATDPFHRYREHYSWFEHLDPVQRMLYTDCGIILPDVYFEKVDKSTMAHSIEARVPMVDTRMAAYVMGLPSTFKIMGSEKKYVLRQALRGVLPDTVLDRVKTGFGVPISYWLRTSLAEYLQSVLFDSATRRAELFDQPALERCVQEHLNGKKDNGRLLYRLLNLALWFDAYRVVD